MSVIGTLTMKQVESLRASGHIAFIYSRKRIVVVDGFKRYNLRG